MMSWITLDVYKRQALFSEDLKFFLKQHLRKKKRNAGEQYRAQSENDCGVSGIHKK